MNRVVLTGRLTKDPEIRTTVKGNKVANFTLAVNRNYSRDEADFIQCNAWSKVADNIEKYCFKGIKIGLTGSIMTGSYENNQGRKVYTTTVQADSIEFLESKKAEQKPEQSSEDSFDFGIDPEGLPF